MGIISSLEWASAEIMDAHLFFLSSNQLQLLNQPWAFTPFIDHEKDIADIYAYLNMSDSFVRAKTIYIMVHKDAIPKAIKSKLGI